MQSVKKDIVIDNYHGTMVADPYRWLEDSSSDKTLEWINQRKKEYDDYFSGQSTVNNDMERLTQLWDCPKYFVPKKIGNQMFYLRNNGVQNHPVLYKKKGEQEIAILDPNSLCKDGTVAIINYSISDDGRYVAYTTSAQGSDWQEIRIRDISTLTDLSDNLKWVKFTTIAWSPDNKGFYYSRFPEKGTVEPGDENRYNKVYYHEIGNSQFEDSLIFEDNRDTGLRYLPLVTGDKKYLCLHVKKGTSSNNKFYIRDIKSNAEFLFLIDSLEAEYSYITNIDTVFYFRNNLGAPKGRLIAIDVKNSNSKNWIEVLPEQEDVLEGIQYVNNRFIGIFLQHAHHKLKVFSVEGIFEYDINLPILGSLTGITGNSDGTEIYFGLTSYITPASIYHFDMKTRKLSTLFEVNLKYSVDKYVTKQVFYYSKDGTKVPMFITHRKDIILNGENPVILYGYGGFNIGIKPTFNPAILLWLEKGGIYVEANIRGGSEYGADWHRAGKLENKQNSFDDFIGAAEWLIQNNYTNPKKISIMGGSNGGLLVAVCMLQRPDLFGAVICQVPVLDMLRYHKFTIGRYWIQEYGCSENPEQFPFLYAYSPLHNVKENQKHPPILISTAEGDDRVVPAHAMKFTAALLEKGQNPLNVIFRFEQKAGHGLGKPTYKVLDEWIDYFRFLEVELKL
ncbi:S9 family peptidase [Sutcliffiella cohnii]|uniref:prolyl oligopeptidase n=1 Tax=Sutcliffiella cohnii TaxID=33932 RepID=A0A223KVS3_9BACI|nr:prolyl oligopeptidase family serine peptidase [Sutcliffiella cohnii]AST93572.1 S9 family peptidase [Sutcliffiella cohnii]